MKDSVYKALSSEYRRAIIKLLRWQNLTAGEIASHFDISKPSISRHLEVLKNAELITDKRMGTYIEYALNMSVVQELQMHILEMLGGTDEKK